MMKRLMTLGFVALFSMSMSNAVFAKDSALVDGSKKPVRVGDKSCMKADKKTKNDSHYLIYYKIKLKKV